MSAPVSLSGQIALVTGAGRGIGRAIAFALAAAGATVVAAARTATQVQETASRITGEGGQAEALPLDITDRTAVEDAIAAVEERHGRIDALVNNAGSFRAIGPAWEVDPDRWWNDVSVNLKGTFLVTRAVLPGMLRRGRGRIINLVGGGTAAPFPQGSGYGASKAAVARFTDTLDQELDGTGVLAFSLSPGLVRTALTEYQLHSPEGQKYMSRIARMFAEGRDVPPTEAGRVAVFLASGRADALHGRIIGVHDDLNALVREADRIVREDRKALRIR